MLLTRLDTFDFIISDTWCKIPAVCSPTWALGAKALCKSIPHCSRWHFHVTSLLNKRSGPLESGDQAGVRICEGLGIGFSLGVR